MKYGKYPEVKPERHRIEYFNITLSEKSNILLGHNEIRDGQSNLNRINLDEVKKLILLKLKTTFDISKKSILEKYFWKYMHNTR